MNAIVECGKAIVGGITGALAFYFGDVTTLFLVLICFIIADYVTGVMVGVSQHTLSSEVGFKGIAKKVFILLLVGVGNILDHAFNTEGLLKSVVCGFYIANEGLSIIENAGLLGVPIPKKLKAFLIALKDKSEKEEEVEVPGDDI